MKKNKSCSVKPKLNDRPLITPALASDIEELFLILGNDTRIRLLHLLAKNEELCVSEIAEQLEMKAQAISNQLQRMTDKDILESRREGNQIFYRIHDPCVVSILDYGLCLIEDSKGGL